MRRRPGGGRRKVCRFCADKALKVDYKDVRTLQNFITEGGKIVTQPHLGQLRAPSAPARGRDKARAGDSAVALFNLGMTELGMTRDDDDG